MRKATFFLLLMLATKAELTAQQITPDSVAYNDLKEVTILSVKDMDARKNSPAAKLVFTSKDFERFELTTIGDR